MPRTGGISIAVAYVLTMGIILFIYGAHGQLEMIDDKYISLHIGLLACFGIGLFDDFRTLNYKSKLIVQILAASIAFYGGVKIDSIATINLNAAVSYLVTVFWFVLFINAVNLIDGLDGLAAGICLIACGIMTYSSINAQSYSAALSYCSIAGSLLGFLRYNFSPANIFMGDSGSYFLGYMIAGLSIISSTKNEIGAIMLMPTIAMGIPVLDTLLSPVRRWIFGKAMFKADNRHIHHQLIRKMGLTAKSAVITLYSISLSLTLLSVMLLQIGNYSIVIIIILLGAAFTLMIRKLGYFEYFTYERIQRWLADVSDTLGFNHDRRIFLNLQVETAQSADLDELWENIGIILNNLKFIKGGLHLRQSISRVLEAGSRTKDRSWTDNNDKINGKMSISAAADGSIQYSWRSNSYDQENAVQRNDLFKIDLPLSDGDRNGYGILSLVKDPESEPLSQITLMRLEHLRRTVTGVLNRIAKEKLIAVSAERSQYGSTSAVFELNKRTV